MRVFLQDCIKTVIDNRGVTPHKRGTEWQDSGIMVLSANNVKTSGLQNMDQVRFISEEVYSSWMKIPLEKGDLILTSEAPAGEVYYWDSDEKVVLGQRLYGLKIKESINSKYLKYYLQSTVGQKAIRQQQSGSTVFGISATTFQSIVVELPERDIQDNIANILSDIDAKIDNNNAIAAELEGMAKDLYDYWFVQFDFPDENGKPYKSSGGKMVWNEELKREIPEGWEATNIGAITICHDSERIPVSGEKRKMMIGSIPYYGATEIMGHVNRAIFNGDYVLLAEDGSVMDDSGHPIIQRISGPSWVNNHAHVLEPEKTYSCRLLMMILKDIPVVQIKTGSIQWKINQENLNKYKIANIPSALRALAVSKLEPIDSMLLDLKKENEELTSLRDFLLPMLLNGQVKVKGA